MMSRCGKPLNLSHAPNQPPAHLELDRRGIEQPELSLPGEVKQLGDDKVRRDQHGEVATL